MHLAYFWQRRAWLCWLALSLPALAQTAPLAATAAAPLAGVPSVEASPTLRKIRDTGIIVLGHRVASPPFSYLDGKLRPVGYSMDLCMKVVEHLRSLPDMHDLEVKLVAVTSATRMPLVANGSVDLECGVTTNTLERQKTQSFSVTTFVAASRLLSKKSSGVRQLDDLRGQVVASTVATTSIQYLTRVNQSRQLGMKIVAGLDDADGFRMVQNGRAQAFAMDDVLLRSAMVAADRPEDYMISDQALSVEPYALGLPRKDPVFKQLVDRVLTDLFATAEIQDIYRRWFQSPLPPTGINLQLPMSEALQRVLRQATDSADPQAYR